MLFNPSRDEARQFFIDVWKKHLDHVPLTPLESLTLDVIGLHPEYHGVLEQAEQALGRDFTPESGDTNPFLHLMLHVSIREQLSIDQPPGVRREYQRITQSLQDEHAAEHALMECLGEMLWRAQRYGTPPDPAVYFSCLAGRG